MLRRDIQSFTLTYGAETYECNAPASVYSILTVAGKKVEHLTDDAVFSAEFEVDSLSLAAKHLYIRLFELQCAAVIYVNGKEVGVTEGVRAQISCSIKEHLVLGKNKLEVRFAKGQLSWEAGIFATVKLLKFSNAVIDGVSLAQRHEDGKVNLAIRLHLLGESDNVRAVATLISCTGQIYYGGLTGGKGSININDPLFWCPKGVGVQNLYRLSINLYGESEIEDSFEIRIGLRSVSTDYAGGALTVNGMKLVLMGAAYYPDRAVDFAGRDKKIEAFITSASMANYNCIIIPHSAARPSAKFYELCDIHGIIVIEEIASLEKDRIDTLERTSHHACLCAVDIVSHSADKATVKTICPDLAVSVLDNGGDYTDSPSLPTYKTITEKIPENERNLFSYSMGAVCSDDHIKRMMMAVAGRYPYPGNLSDFAYTEGIAAAECVSDRIKKARISADKNDRAVFHTLGDEGLVSSSSAMDSAARWKPLQYYAARSFSPLLLCADASGSVVSFKISNLRNIDLIGSIEYRIVDSGNITIFKGSEPCEVSAFTTAEVLTKDFSEYIGNHHREYYLEYFIKESALVLSKGTLLFVPEKYFKFKKPSIKAEVVGSDRRFSVTLSADCFVKGLELEFEGVDAVFSDNYIDITSAAPIKVSFTVTGGIESAYRLNSLLKLRSMYDIAN